MNWTKEAIVAMTAQEILAQFVEKGESRISGIEVEQDFLAETTGIQSKANR